MKKVLAMAAILAFVMTLGVIGCKKADAPKEEIPTMEQPKDAAKPEEAKK